MRVAGWPGWSRRAAAWLLHLILLPDPASAAADTAARSHPSPGGAELPRAARVPDQRWAHANGEEKSW